MPAAPAVAAVALGGRVTEDHAASTSAKPYKGPKGLGALPGKTLRGAKGFGHLARPAASGPSCPRVQGSGAPLPGPKTQLAQRSGAPLPGPKTQLTQGLGAPLPGPKTQLAQGLGVPLPGPRRLDADRKARSHALRGSFAAGRSSCRTTLPGSMSQRSMCCTTRPPAARSITCVVPPAAACGQAGRQAGGMLRVGDDNERCLRVGLKF